VGWGDVGVQWAGGKVCSGHALAMLCHPMSVFTLCLFHPLAATSQVYTKAIRACIPIYWVTGVPQYVVLHSHMLGVPRHVGMHPHTLEYPSISDCIPIYWSTPVHRTASPHSGVPERMGTHPLTLVFGVPQFIGMHPHRPGYPSMWGCIPMYWDTPL
jgi:hypothetical protein